MFQPNPTMHATAPAATMPGWSKAWLFMRDNPRSASADTPHTVRMGTPTATQGQLWDSVSSPSHDVSEGEANHVTAASSGAANSPVASITRPTRRLCTPSSPFTLDAAIHFTSTPSRPNRAAKAAMVKTVKASSNRP